MNRLATRVALIAALLSPAPGFAGSPEAPRMDPEVITPEPSTTDPKLIAGLLLLLVVIATAINSGSSAATGGAPIPPVL